MADEKKGITVKIDADLNAEIKEYLERHEGMTMAEFTADAHGRQAVKRKSCGDASTALNTPRNTVTTRHP